MLVCAFLCANLHTRPRVQRAPCIPCSLRVGGKRCQRLGRIAPRDREVLSDTFGRATLSVVITRRWVIQYSRDVRDDADKPGRTGYPHARGPWWGVEVARNRMDLTDHSTG